MFSDTSSCNTGTNLSPLTAAPTASSTRPRCTSCSLALFFTVSELLLKYLASTPAHRHVLPFFCLAGVILAWQYKLERCSVEVLQNPIWLLRIFFSHVQRLRIWSPPLSAEKQEHVGPERWCRYSVHWKEVRGNKCHYHYHLSCLFKLLIGRRSSPQMLVSPIHIFRSILITFSSCFTGHREHFQWMLQEELFKRGMDHSKHGRRKSAKLIAYSV